MEFHKLSAIDLSNKIKNNEIKVADMIDYMLERVDTIDKKINAFVSIDKENILNIASSLDQNNEKSGSLYGVPVAIKDNILVKGQKTTASSKMLENFVAPYDATVIKKMRDAGIIPFGKTNLDEFAMGSSNETSYFGSVSNPFDLDRIPGGSSGGSASCVASSQAFLSLGSDTGGSVRQPASMCGILGLKPTYGRISRYGLIAFGSSLDQIGIFGKYAKDIASLLEIIAGYDENDPTSSKMEVAKYSKLLNKDLKGLKIGLPIEYFPDTLDKDIKNCIDEAIKKLENKGVIFEKISLPHTKYAISTYYILSSAEAASNLARFDGVRYGYRQQNVDNIEDLYVKSRTNGFGREVKKRIMIGNHVLCSGFYDAYYKKAAQIRRLIKNDFDNALSKVDMILTPTSPVLAFKKGEKIKDELTMYLADIYTVSINLAGLPAISIPCGFVDNLPCGMQIIGNYFKEDQILNFANEFEKIRGDINYEL